MKCMLCENYSLTQHICSSCQENFLQPSLYKRTLSNGVEVFSFYKYEDIKPLLFTKHTNLGFYIYTLLAKLSFKKFAENFVFPESVAAIGVDDRVESGYAHTAILNHALKSKAIQPLYAKLHAQSNLSYSGKSKAFRVANPRDFKLKKFKQKNVILVDDIITTGTTLTEATNLLHQAQKDILFCLTLADVN